jgi:hypothetical protein
MSSEPNPYASPSHEPDQPAGGAAPASPRTSIEFAYLFDDMVNFSEHHYFHSPSFTGRIRRAQIGRAVAAFIFAAGAVFINQIGPNIVILPTAFLVGAILMAFRAWRAPAFIRKQIRKNLTAFFSEDGNAREFGRQHVSIRDDGLFIETDHGYSFQKWNAITRADHASEYFFIYLSTASALPVPARVFASEADFQAFADLVQEKIDQHTDDRA